MSVVVIATAFPVPEHRAEVIATLEATIARVHDEPGVELYALHEEPDRLIMIEKYKSEQALSEHSNGAALADLMSALEGRPQVRPRWGARADWSGGYLALCSQANRSGGAISAVIRWYRLNSSIVKISRPAPERPCRKKA